jgi:hypothetical protein
MHDDRMQQALASTRMRAPRLVLPILVVVAALAAAGCGGDGDLPKLIATVGSADDPDAYEISLRTEDGAEITTTLPPGEYRLEIDDRSTIHNFHLYERDRGLDVASEIEGTGTQTTTVVFPEPASYIYVCDAHPDRMRETFSIHDRIRTEN